MKKNTFISLTCSLLLGAFSLGAATSSTQTRVLSEKLVSTNGSLSASDVLTGKVMYKTPSANGSPSESKALAEKALSGSSAIKGFIPAKEMPKSLSLQEKALVFSMDVNNPYLAKAHVQFNTSSFSSATGERRSPSLNYFFTSELYWNALIGNESFKELVDFVEENKAELIEEYQSPYVLIDLFGATEVDSKRRIAMKINSISSLDISDEALVAIRATSAYPKGYDIIHFSFFEYEGVVMYKLRFAVKIKN